MIRTIAIIGGFLGAGKTTLLLTAAQRLAARGYRVGLITNDQGADLVDTALAVQADIPVTEVAGGCFCCRFPDLLAGLQRLIDAADPHIILAEPVGSCTDLIATVLRPLVSFYGEHYRLAPLTVLHDATRHLDAFAPDVRYLHDRQLAEAELILLNKCDLLARDAAQPLANLATTYPQAQAFAASAKSGEGVDAWLDIVLGQESRNPEALLIDYERYAQAEAALGWLNARGLVRADEPFSAATWLEALLIGLAQACADEKAPIAHIKALVTTPQASLKASLAQSGSAVTWDLRDDSSVTNLEFTLNVRANAAPGWLEQIVHRIVELVKPSPDARYYFTHFECFSPLPPQPTHRIETPVAEMHVADR
ncbi:MAG: GTP-binding protein [Caldilineaceae bacterium]